ncbi:glycoside hydrolase [Fusarium mexicanum]|uniref:xylan 1,4-beta-xylosidase n=1 Tax=Fusarium mexicanum TaxID=751941 RepID=A0A8H5IQR1_9HYPO|nr:glycoside hydrolase [Fusarium mexicanum]
MLYYTIFGLVGLAAAAQSSPFVCTGVAPFSDYTASTQSLGCYTDSTQRILTSLEQDLSQNTPQLCANFCGSQGYTFSATEYGNQCYCGNNINSPGASTQSCQCDSKCAGNSSQTCGGTWAMSVVKISNPSSIAQYFAITDDLGCYTDSTQRTLTGFSKTSSNATRQGCANLYGNYGFNIQSPGASTSSSKCYSKCGGDSSQICGGTWAMSLLKISNPSSNPISVDKRTPVCKTNPFCAQRACDTTLSISDRVRALISNMTIQEKAANLINTAAGVDRIGLPAYEWWNEALHGTGDSPGVTFASPNGSDFSYATSFATPILIGAAFDDSLVLQIAQTVGKESRAFGNGNHAGLDFWTPNINTFNDPRWGRGLEVPTEDVLQAQRYVLQLVKGLQGTTGSDQKQVIATCEHYAVYDVETNRNGQNYNPTQQDLGEFYFPAFKTCVRDAGVGSIMCSYNAVDGVPSCANEYLLKTVLREHWGFGNQPYQYVTGDCDAVNNIWDSHKFVGSAAEAAAVAIDAGTDSDCGYNGFAYNPNLLTAVDKQWTTEATMDQALTRLYTALFTVGYFDGQSQYDSLGWQDVSTGDAQQLAYTSAAASISLLKNNGALPIQDAGSKKIALISPWANATTQMQGIYQGRAPYLKSPLEAARANFNAVNYALGTKINTADTSGFSDATTAASKSDIKLGKPLIVVQFGDGQIDDSALLSNPNVSSVVWAGYPGQSGGYAVVDTLVGKFSPAGRLPVTQYPAAYTSQVSIFDPNVRPSSKSPGRTYKWYTGKPVLPFGYGLHYNNFSISTASTLKSTYDIASLVAAAKNDASTFDTLTVAVKNTGKVTSDYVALMIVSTKDGGPSPYPNKSLVSYARAKSIGAGQTKSVDLAMTLGSIARANSDGDLVLYPGHYNLILDAFDAEPSVIAKVELRTTSEQTLDSQTLAIVSRTKVVKLYIFTGSSSASLGQLPRPPGPLVLQRLDPDSDRPKPAECIVLPEYKTWDFGRNRLRNTDNLEENVEPQVDISPYVSTSPDMHGNAQVNIDDQAEVFIRLSAVCLSLAVERILFKVPTLVEERDEGVESLRKVLETLSNVKSHRLNSGKYLFCRGRIQYRDRYK